MSSDLNNLRQQLNRALSTQYDAQVAYTTVQAQVYSAQEAVNAKQASLNTARGPLLSAQKVLNLRKITLDSASFKVNSLRAQIQMLTST